MAGLSQEPQEGSNGLDQREVISLIASSIEPHPMMAEALVALGILSPADAAAVPGVLHGLPVRMAGVIRSVCASTGSACAGW